MTQAIDKDSLPLNKPRRTPNHPTKSHVVKTKVDGKEKIIRFGEQGAETAGKPKAGESEHMKQKRASFKARHAANIAKGPSSAAYWANKVKWADGGSVDVKDATLNKIAKMFGDNGESVIEDYSQLLKAYPNAKKFLKALQSNIESHIPTTEDLQSPERMGEWSLAAALNQPTGLTFIGKNARNWDAQSAKLAEEKLNAGADPAEVWREHLIGRLPGGHLFSEINDQPSKLPTWMEEKRIDNKPIDRTSSIGTNFWHKDLYSEYPDLRTMQSHMVLDDRMPWEKPATGNLTNDKITIEAGNLGDAKSTALHELQHAVQKKEGWPRGGNSKMFKSDYEYPQIRDANILDKMLNHYDILSALGKFEERFKRKPELGAEALVHQIGQGNITPEMVEKAKLALDPENSYMRLTGEAQARATQDRRNMSMDERRANYPMTGGSLGGIPLEQLINRYLEKPDNYAQGGAVQYDPAKIDAIIAAIPKFSDDEIKTIMQSS